MDLHWLWSDLHICTCLCLVLCRFINLAYGIDLMAYLFGDILADIARVTLR